MTASIENSSENPSEKVAAESVEITTEPAQSELSQAPEDAPMELVTADVTDFSFLPASVQEALAAQGIETPTPIQKEAIGPALAGWDILAQAQTGSGKTLAFGLPVGVLLEGPSDHGLPRALVLAPTRELANQVEAVFSSTLASLGLRCLPIIGGASYSRQKRALREGVDIVVGTPGRIADLIQQKSLQLQQIRCFVLDEVDQMLDIGFAEELDVVRTALPEDVQVLFFSATVDGKVAKVSQSMLQEPIHIDLSIDDATPTNIEHRCIPVKDGQRLPALINTLLYHAPRQALLFCATREQCREVADALEQRGFNAAPLSGDLSQEAREATLRRFHNGALQYLVATNVAARGLDIQSLPLVLNYDVPPDLESYTHRIGRTGRAGEDGHAWTLVTPKFFRRYRFHMKDLGLPVEFLEMPSQHDILTRAAERRVVELFEAADAPVPRNVRRLTDFIIETIEPDDAVELVRGMLRRYLAGLDSYDSRQISATKDDLKDRRKPRHRSHHRRSGGPSRGGRPRHGGPKKRSRNDGGGRDEAKDRSQGGQGKPKKHKSAKGKPKGYKPKGHKPKGQKKG